MDISKASNLNEVFINNFEEFSSKPAMQYRINGVYESLSYRQLKARVLRVVNYLVHVGLKPQDRTVIWSKARPEWVWTDLAVMMAGGIGTTIPVAAKNEEITWVLNDLKAKFLFVETQAQLDVIKTLKDKMPALQLVFVFGEVENPAEWVVPYTWLFEFSTQAVGMGIIYEMAEKQTRNTLLTVSYPENLSDRSSGICYSHGNCLETVTSVTNHFGPHFEGVKTNLSFLSPSNPFARFADYYFMLITGRCLCFADGEEQIVANIKEIKPDVLFVNPDFIEKLHKDKEAEIEKASFFGKKKFNWAVKNGKLASEHLLSNNPVPGMLKLKTRMANTLVYKKIKKEFGGNLRFLVYAGEPLEEDILRYFHALGVTVLETFGAPQTAFAATVNLPGKMKIGSIGIPLPNTSVRISEHFEVEIKGPGLFTGYYNAPGKTRAAFTADGFFRTGKTGRIEDDFFYITGEKSRK